ncbi:MAG: peptidase [Pirellulales bacterium]|nr:peptidase [Pirellulales bacterium]
MLLGEPARTQADLNFPLLGVQVRVSPFFWLAAVILGMGGSRILAGGGGEADPKQVLIFVVAAFLSILIHEFGHVLAYRRYGIGAHIVLYHFGGLAVPGDAHFGAAYGRSLDPKAQIFVSAAGPAAQLIAAACLVIVLKAGGFSVLLWIPLVSSYTGLSTFLFQGDPIPNLDMSAFVSSFLQVSVFWALINLMPVYPLDGGQISRNLFVMKDPRGGIVNSLKLSIGTGILLAVYAIWGQQVFMAILFGMLAFSSYQMLMQYTGRGGGMNPW